MPRSPRRHRSLEGKNHEQRLVISQSVGPERGTAVRGRILCQQLHAGEGGPGRLRVACSHIYKGDVIVYFLLLKHMFVLKVKCEEPGRTSPPRKPPAHWSELAKEPLKEAFIPQNLWKLGDSRGPGLRGQGTAAQLWGREQPLWWQRLCPQVLGSQ